MEKVTWAAAIFIAGIGGFAAWCLTILLSVIVNAISPARVPLWATTILALLFITYWYVTWFGEDRVERLLRRKPKVAAFTENPQFPIGDPRRNPTRQFYSLRKAGKWINEQAALGAIIGSIKDVREEDEGAEQVLHPAPYTSTRLKLTLAYVLLVMIIAVAVQLFVETAFPDKALSASDARREAHRQFPFWASMILTWIWLAHAELKKEA